MKSKSDLDFYLKSSRRQRFGLRKTFLGLAAVTLGSTLYLTNGQLVHADQVVDNPSEEVRQEDNSQVAKATENSKNVAAADLAANQAVNKEEVKITTKAVDASGNETSDLNPNQTKEMMAGQDNVNVHIALNNLTADDKQIDMSFSNVGTDKDFVFNSGNLKDGQSIELGSWQLNNQGAGKLVAKWQDSTSNPSNLSLVIPIIGNRKVINSQVNGANVDLQISSQTINTNQPVIKANLKPYADHVQEVEIIKGFPMIQTDVASEKNTYHNISEDDFNQMAMKPDQTILQWGAYFNYGPTLNHKALEDAIFNLLFNGDQKLIPSSIKVYQVPDGMVADSNGNRHNIDDPYPVAPSDIKYYEKIIANDNYNADFSNYLRDSIKDNGISVDQSSKGVFSVPNVANAAKHAYFFQMDTLLPTKQKDGGKSDSITTSSKMKGTGVVEQTIAWTGEITGGGSGEKIEKAVIRFYDDTAGQFLDQKNDVEITGAPAKPIDFGPTNYQNLINLGYVYVGYTQRNDELGKPDSTPFNEINFGEFDNTDNKDGKDPEPQFFVVHLKHGFAATEDQDEVKETVHYKYANGPHAGQQASPDVDHTVTFIRDGEMDLVTKKTTWDKWQPKSQTFEQVDSPLISGYTADKKQIAQQSVNQGAADLEFTVYYYEDLVPNPNPTPGPTQPTEPTNPSQPTSPKNPTTPKVPKKPTPSSHPKQNKTHTNKKVMQKATFTRQRIARSLPKKSRQVKQNQLLPQTGTKNSEILAILGNVFLGLGLLAFLGKRKKHE